MGVKKQGRLSRINLKILCCNSRRSPHTGSPDLDTVLSGKIFSSQQEVDSRHNLCIEMYIEFICLRLNVIPERLRDDLLSGGLIAMQRQKLLEEGAMIRENYVRLRFLLQSLKTWVVTGQPRNPSSTSGLRSLFRMRWLDELGTSKRTRG